MPANIKGQYCLPVGQKDSGFSQGVRISQLVEHVGVGWSNLGNDYLGLGQALDNVLNDDPRPVDVGRPVRFNSQINADRPNHVLIESVELWSELHDHKC